MSVRLKANEKNQNWKGGRERERERERGEKERKRVCVLIVRMNETNKVKLAAVKLAVVHVEAYAHTQR